MWWKWLYLFYVLCLVEIGVTEAQYNVAPPHCPSDVLNWDMTTKLWSCNPLVIGLPPPGVPSGLIMMILSGVCPEDYTEVTSLQNQNLLGTTTFAGDVGIIDGHIVAISGPGGPGLSVVFRRVIFCQKN